MSRLSARFKRISNVSPWLPNCYFHGMDATHAPAERRLEQVMARHGYSGDALIEVLHAAQMLYGYLPPPVLRHIARRLKLPPSRAMGVATFYHLFHTRPRDRRRITVCQGTACYVAGSKALADRAIERNWNLDIGRCVGFCGLAPVVVCDGLTIGRLDASKLEELLAKKDAADDQ